MLNNLKNINRLIFVFVFAIIAFGVFSFNDVAADSNDIVLFVGEKETIPNTGMELLVKNIDGSGAVSFYFESELIKLAPGESKTIKKVVISIINSSYEEKQATFRVIIETPPLPPVLKEISPEHASEKIVRHGYALIDAYAKEMSEFRCTFPDGQFRFWFNGGTGKDVLISPSCVPPAGIWRIISFINTDGTASIIVLDGPISGTPGTPNEQAIKGAISNLSLRLSESKMLVKIVYRDDTPDLNFDLSRESDFQKFIDLMFGTIKLSKPLASGPIPTEMTLPEGTLLKINPGNKQLLETEKEGISAEIVKTKVVFNGQRKDISITSVEEGKKIEIDIGGEKIITKSALELKEGKLYVKTNDVKEEVKITPTESLRAVGLKEAKEIQLEEKNQKPIYSIKGIFQARLFFVIPVEVKIQAETDAQTGEIISIRRPWWAFLAR